MCHLVYVFFYRSQENIFSNIKIINSSGCSIACDGGNNRFYNVVIKGDLTSRGKLIFSGRDNLFENLTCFPENCGKISVVIHSDNSGVVHSVCDNIEVNAKNVNLTDVDCGYIIVRKGASDVSLLKCRAERLERNSNAKIVGHCNVDQIVNNPETSVLSETDKKVLMQYKKRIN